MDYQYHTEINHLYHIWLLHQLMTSCLTLWLCLYYDINSIIVLLCCTNTLSRLVACAVCASL